MKNKLLTLLLTILSVTPALAKVDSASFPTTVVEESIVSFKGTKFDSASNPLSVSLITADGASVSLSASAVNKKKGQIILPTVPASVAGLIQVTLRISGGDVSSSDPQNFVVLLAQRPVSAPSSLPAGTVSVTLPETTSDGIGVEGPQGPAGATGTTGPAGSAGPPGPAGTFPPSVPGSIVTGTVANAANATQVTLPIQGFITTLPALVSAGTVGVTTNVLGSVDIDQNLNVDGTLTAAAFSGPVTGNVTGNLTGNVNTATQNSITTMTGLTAAGTTAVTTTFAGPVAAPEGVTANVTGNLTGQVLTATQNNITTLPALVSAGTAGVTTNVLGSVDIDQNLNVDGTLTGAAFSGPLTGNVSGNVTGNLTGQVSTPVQSTITTLPALVAAGTAGVTTNFAGPVTAPQGFTGDLTGTIQTAAQPNIATMIGLTNAGTAGTQTQFQGPVKGNQGFIGDLTGDVTGNVNGNVNGNATNATNATNVIGASQAGITSLSGIAQLGSFGSTANFAGSANVAQNLNVVGTLTAGTLNSSGTITATKFNGPLQGQVLTVSQPLITTMAGLTSAGTAGVTTNFLGSVGIAQNLNVAGTTTGTFSGNLTGNVTGNADTSTTAGTVTAAAQPAITTLANLTSVGGSTAFGGTVSATAFSGPITGNVTGNVTGSAGTLDGDAASAAGQLNYDDTAANWATTIVAGGAAAVITLPATTSTLATTTGLTPMAVGSVTQAAVSIDVTGLNFVKLTTGAFDLETLTGGVDGQKVTLLYVTAGTNDVTENGNIKVEGATFAAPTTGSTLSLVYDATTTTWYEVGRSAN